MRPARTHRAQLKLPIHLSVADRGQSFIGQTIDVSRTGFSVQVKTDERLPTILTAEIRPRGVTHEPIPCKARMISDLRFLYLPTSLQPEVSRQAPRIASVLCEALGVPPKRAAAILSQTIATKQKVGVLR